MNLEMDKDVKAVAEHMQATVPAAKLVAAAEALSAVAPLLWGSYERQAVQTLCLRSEPISADGQPKQSGASE